MFVYYYYILAVLVIGLICAFMVRRMHHEEESNSNARRPGVESATAKSGLKGAAPSQSDGKSVWATRDRTARLERELHSVRTPWGWPRASAERGKRQPEASAQMHALSSRILRKKKRLESTPAESRSKESLRALIEDRYVPAKWNSPNEIEYRKVKRPLLRDPRAPFDQMDNFGVQPAEKVRKKLQRVVKMNVDADVVAKQDEFRYVSRKLVKQPWGW